MLLTFDSTVTEGREKKLWEGGICFGSLFEGIRTVGVGKNISSTCDKIMCTSKQIRQQNWYRKWGQSIILKSPPQRPTFAGFTLLP